MEKAPTGLPSGSVLIQNGPLSLYHSSTDIMAMERPIALTSSDIAALDINPGASIPPIYGRLVGEDSLMHMSSGAPNLNTSYQPKPQYINANNDTNNPPLLNMPLQVPNNTIPFLGAMLIF